MRRLLSSGGWGEIKEKYREAAVPARAAGNTAKDGLRAGACSVRQPESAGERTAAAAVPGPRQPSPLQPFHPLAQEQQLRFCLFLMKSSNQFLAVLGDAI